MKNYRSLSFLVSLLLFSLVGCSGNVTTIGTVKFTDGTPLSEGQIIYQNDLHEFLSVIKPDGTYSIWGVREGDGIPPGTYSVFLRFPAYEFINQIPVAPKFASADSSGFIAEVVPGKRNRFDFEVEPNLSRADTTRRTEPPTSPQGR